MEARWKSTIQTHSVKALGLENVPINSVQFPPSSCASTVNAPVFCLIINLLLRLWWHDVCGWVRKHSSICRLYFVFRMHST